MRKQVYVSTSGLATWARAEALAQASGRSMSSVIHDALNLWCATKNEGPLTLEETVSEAISALGAALGAALQAKHTTGAEPELWMKHEKA